MMGKTGGGYNFIYDLVDMLLLIWYWDSFYGHILLNLFTKKSAAAANQRKQMNGFIYQFHKNHENQTLYKH